MAEYLTIITEQLGVPLWLFIILIVWSSAWKLIALWKAARKDSLPWFIILAIFNTAGILPILYIFVFSKMKSSSKPVTKTKKKIPKKKK